MELRRVGRRPSSALLTDEIPASGETPLERAIGRQTLERYERALERLRPEDRELVIAHIEFGFSHRELAEAFDKPSANAARMALQRAMRRVAEEMARTL
jgi:RNA polymerase sigma-70 factor (ECF subfamily)